MMESGKRLASARQDDLIVRHHDDETLIYDLRRDEAICLNFMAAQVWRRCDGSSTPEQIADDIARVHGMPVGASVVRIALAGLEDKDLLEASVDAISYRIDDSRRREFLRTIGIGAGTLLPAITSIVVPTPAQAQSCLPTGFVCTSNAQCCSNLCLAGLVCA